MKLFALILALVFSFTAFADVITIDTETATLSELTEAIAALVAERDARLTIDAETSIGDTVTFGIFEQDYNFYNGAEPIEWVVLDSFSDGSLLLLSKYALTSKPYNAPTFEDATWEQCTLRAWLNGPFYDEAFSETEKAQIIATPLVNENNPNTDTDSGNDTEDRVFLLSSGEVNVYLKTDADRQCTPTDYAIAQSINCNTIDTKVSISPWWTRSIGTEPYLAQYVQFLYGKYGIYDLNNHYTGIGVRPAIRIHRDLEATTETTGE